MGPVRRVLRAVSWTPPTSTEVGVVVKSGLAAGLAWWIAGVVTDVPDPVLAPLTAIVIVQVSVRASVRTALQRSAAVVLGILVAVLIGDAVELNGFTIGVLVALSLGVGQLLLKLPAGSARQLPISVLVVLTTVTGTLGTYGWRRGLETVVGAAVGVVVSLVLPASRLVDASQTMERLGAGLGRVLEAMGAGLQERWSTDQTTRWRREARTVRERLVAEATEAVGNVRESARWNVRDRRHIDTLGRYEAVLPRLQRTAIGVSVISRGLDDHARLSGAGHRPMAAMGALLTSLGTVVRGLTTNVLGDCDQAGLDRSFAELQAGRDRCVLGASRRARLALDHEDDPDGLEGEWLGYAAVLEQVDRIIGDLRAPLSPDLAGSQHHPQEVMTGRGAPTTVADMGCLLALFSGVFPRLALFMFWILRPARVDAAFDTWLLPLLGIVFLPFATLMYAVLHTPGVGLTGWEWFWVTVAGLLDLSHLAVGASQRGDVGRRGARA